jgi:hypothetical protein
VTSQIECAVLGAGHSTATAAVALTRPQKPWHLDYQSVYPVTFAWFSRSHYGSSQQIHIVTVSQKLMSWAIVKADSEAS